MIAEGAPGPSRTRGTIVIAEDDPSTRIVLDRVLSREDFRVVAVENGRLACDAVRREKPDVVLLDWRMPVMDGRAALQELRASEETRGIPIVMLTSYSQVDERIIALETGVQDFLSKPFDPRELVACIEQQLRWRQGLALEADSALLAERESLNAASERRYRLLAEAMPHIVWIAGANGEITYFNRLWYDYVGGTPDNGSAAAQAFAIHPDDRTASLRAWSIASKTGSPFEMQFRLRRASDGAFRWHLARAIPAQDETGAIVEWVGSCADIHDYKIASETRAIVDAMGGIVAIRRNDGFVDYASTYWSTYTGAGVGSALGFGWREFVHADDHEHVDRSRSELSASDPNTHQFELRLRGRDGVYRWFLSRTTILPGVAETGHRWIDTLTDVDDLKRTQTALANSEARYRALTDSMPQMVWVTAGSEAAYEYVNNRWTEYTGLDLASMQATWRAVVHPEDAAALAAMGTASPQTEFAGEARFRRHDGSYRWHAVRAVRFDDLAGGGSKWIGTATDVEDSKAAAALLARTAADLEHLAHHDPMTNLPNRTLLAERLAQSIALAQRAKTELLVLYVDLDRFKVINDTRGHAAGDRVLAVTGQRIADALRVGDTASRVGGDEFILVCATNGAAGEAARLASRLLAAIGAPIDIGGEDVSVGASIGISMYPADGVSGEELIRKADSAMYAAKQSGRNLFRIYAPETHSSIIAEMDLEAELHTAVTSGEIVVHYQPIVSLRTNRLIGAEALVRWQHPRRGLLGPDDFLAVAESHRLIGEIGRIVLDAVCAQIAALDTVSVYPTWRLGRATNATDSTQLNPHDDVDPFGSSVDPNFHISMNICAGQLLQPGWAAGVAAALESHGADPRRLQIELAENIVMSERTRVNAVLDELRSLGVSLSIDDFGTGYSSLASIRNFPLHTLKIDRSFVRGIATNAGDQAVAKTIIALAHNLGLNVVAAGVETTEQIAALRNFGSDAFQGYLASRPMAAAEFTAFVVRHDASAK